MAHVSLPHLPKGSRPTVEGSSAERVPAVPRPPPRADGHAPSKRGSLESPGIRRADRGGSASEVTSPESSLSSRFRQKIERERELAVSEKFNLLQSVLQSERDTRAVIEEDQEWARTRIERSTVISEMGTRVTQRREVEIEEVACRKTLREEWRTSLCQLIFLEHENQLLFREFYHIRNNILDEWDSEVGILHRCSRYPLDSINCSFLVRMARGYDGRRATAARALFQREQLRFAAQRKEVANSECAPRLGIQTEEETQRLDLGRARLTGLHTLQRKHVYFNYCLLMCRIHVDQQFESLGLLRHLEMLARMAITQQADRGSPQQSLTVRFRELWEDYKKTRTPPVSKIQSWYRALRSGRIGHRALLRTVGSVSQNRRTRRKIIQGTGQLKRDLAELRSQIEACGTPQPGPRLAELQSGESAARDCIVEEYEWDFRRVARQRHFEHFARAGARVFECVREEEGRRAQREEAFLDWVRVMWEHREDGVDHLLVKSIQCHCRTRLSCRMAGAKRFVSTLITTEQMTRRDHERQEALIRTFYEERWNRLVIRVHAQHQLHVVHAFCQRAVAAVHSRELQYEVARGRLQESEQQQSQASGEEELGRAAIEFEEYRGMLALQGSAIHYPHGPQALVLQRFGRGHISRLGTCHKFWGSRLAFAPVVELRARSEILKDEQRDRHVAYERIYRVAVMHGERSERAELLLEAGLVASRLHLQQQNSLQRYLTLLLNTEERLRAALYRNEWKDFIELIGSVEYRILTARQLERVAVQQLWDFETGLREEVAAAFDRERGMLRLQFHETVARDNLTRFAEMSMEHLVEAAREAMIKRLSVVIQRKIDERQIDAGHVKDLPMKVVPQFVRDGVQLQLESMLHAVALLEASARGGLAECEARDRQVALHDEAVGRRLREEDERLRFSEVEKLKYVEMDFRVAIVAAERVDWKVVVQLSLENSKRLMIEHLEKREIRLFLSNIEHVSRADIQAQEGKEFSALSRYGVMEKTDLELDELLFVEELVRGLFAKDESNQRFELKLLEGRISVHARLHEIKHH